MRFTKSVPCVLAILVPAAVLHAQKHGDVAPLVENGRIVTWLGVDDPPPGSLIGPARVFAAEFPDPGTIGPGDPIINDEPGYLGLPGNPLEGFSLGFNIRTYLRAWSVGAQEFPDAAASTTITASAPIIGSVTTPLTAMLVPGLTLPSLPVGGFDFHFDHELNANTPGIYLLELELFTNRPGTANSLPFWVVFNYGLPESEHEAALDWVEANLVPAPGGAVLLALAGILASRRRRA
ncbi:MAG: hypothetical protein ACKVU4_15490 [Phycisphaerales bacterium]